jgi:hypothetical protein
MILNCRSLYCAVAILSLQGCGVSVDSSSSRLDNDFVAFDIYEYDAFEEEKTLISSECINLDREWEDGHIDITESGYDDLEFGWKLRDEQIQFTMKSDRDIYSSMNYDIDYFADGGEVRQRIIVDSRSFWLKLSGPECLE